MFRFLPMRDKSLEPQHELSRLRISEMALILGRIGLVFVQIFELDIVSELKFIWNNDLVTHHHLI